MSAQLAHQLRNPLTSMQLYVQLLEDELHGGGDSGPAEALDLLQLVLHELKVLVEITDNYLQYARLPELAPAALDVNRAVGELVRFLRPEASRKGIALSTQFAEGLPPVEADRRLVRFALMNLLKNGVEAMAQGGRLRVKTAQQNGAVEIHVSDTGPGIETSEAEHIFEPFYTTKDSGSGLGLSLSRQIIEKHNGSLTCESMVGVGTTFVVKLPVEA
jgi:signal transduction histidine kinase